jgi:hypothetical protein
MIHLYIPQTVLGETSSIRRPNIFRAHALSLITLWTAPAFSIASRRDHLFQQDLFQ